MWNQLRDAIYNLVNTSSKVDSSVAVYKYNATDISGYPAITITPKTGSGVFADTMRNDRHYIFSIKCWQETVGVGEEQAESTLIGLIDDLIQIFDAKPYLYGDMLAGRGFSHPIPSDWRLVSAEQAAVMIAELLIDVEVIQ